MPGFDDRLKQHLERAAPPADPSGAFDRILEKKIRRRIMRRVQAAGLVVAVVAATVTGTFLLYDAFRPRRVVTPRPGDLPLTGNGKVVFVRDAAGTYDIFSIEPDGTDIRQLTRGLTSDVFPTWSPDGQRVAFVRATEEMQEIAVMDLAGARQVNLTNTPTVEEGDPAWSPDGRRIAFASRPNDGLPQIWVMNADGTGARELTDLPFGVNHPVWSPDGRRIAFSETGAGGPGGIWVMNASGGRARRIFEDTEAVDLLRAGSWSPDGKSLLFTRVVSSAEGNSSSDVYAIGADGSGLEQLTADGMSGEAVWSPDGMRITYTGGDSVRVMNADGSDSRLLVDGAATFGVSWQPVTSGSSPSPEPELTPTTFPSACDPSVAFGDFNGDGQPDKATVAKTECLPREAAGDTAEYSLHVQWPPSEGVAPLPDCRKVCRALAGADLNGDGIDEFILQVDAGASTDFIQVYELPASEAFGRPAIVAPPGSPPRWPPGEPAEFSLYGSVTHYHAVGCDLINNQVIVQSAALDSDQMRWSVHESILRFDPTDGEPFGQFTVVSERDYTEPAEENVGPGDQFEPGDPCWIATG